MTGAACAVERRAKHWTSDDSLEALPQGAPTRGTISVGNTRRRPFFSHSKGPLLFGFLPHRPLDRGMPCALSCLGEEPHSACCCTRPILCSPGPNSKIIPTSLPSANSSRPCPINNSWPDYARPAVAAAMIIPSSISGASLSSPSPCGISPSSPVWPSCTATPLSTACLASPLPPISPTPGTSRASWTSSAKNPT